MKLLLQYPLYALGVAVGFVGLPFLVVGYVVGRVGAFLCDVAEGL